MSEAIYVNEAEAHESADLFADAEAALEEALEHTKLMIDYMSSWEGEAATQAKASTEEIKTRVDDLIECSGASGDWVLSATDTYQETDQSCASSYCS